MNCSEPTVGLNLTNPILAPSVEAEYEYLRFHPCTCGGEWELQRQCLVMEKSPIDQLMVQCSRCKTEVSFFFQLQGTREDDHAFLDRFEDFLRQLEEEGELEEWLKHHKLR